MLNVLLPEGRFYFKIVASQLQNGTEKKKTGHLVYLRNPVD